MTIVEQTAGRLVLQEKPWLVLVVGGLFVIAGATIRNTRAPIRNPGATTRIFAPTDSVVRC